ncbi:hypothetical protein GCM10027039_04270 [Terrabacter koreensis]
MTAAARVHRHRRLLPYAAALVAAATLGSCSGGDPGPATATPPVTSTATTTTTASPSTTTTPASTATVDPVIAKIPAAARTNNRDGAVAFAQFYFDALNRAFRTGHAEFLAALGEDSCVTCKAFAEGVEQLEAKGQRYGGDLVSVSNASPITFGQDAKSILLEIEQGSVPILNKTGARVGITPGGKASFVASVDFKAGRWSMTRLQKATS